MGKFLTLRFCALTTALCEGVQIQKARRNGAGPGRNGGVTKEKIAYVDKANGCAQLG